MARTKKIRVLGGYISYYYDSRGHQHRTLVVNLPKTRWEDRPFTEFTDGQTTIVLKKKKRRK